MSAVILLQFSTSPGIGSALIRWFSAGGTSHVDAVLPGPSNWLVGSRAKGGVRIRPRAYADFASVVRIEIECEPEHAGRFYHFLDTQIGRPYDFRAIVGFAIGRNWRDDDSWICSELIARGLEVAGVFARPLYLPINKITPTALALALSALPNVRFTKD